MNSAQVKAEPESALSVLMRQAEPGSILSMAVKHEILEAAKSTPKPVDTTDAGTKPPTCTCWQPDGSSATEQLVPGEKGCLVAQFPSGIYETELSYLLL